MLIAAVLHIVLSTTAPVGLTEVKGNANGNGIGASASESSPGKSGSAGSQSNGRNQDRGASANTSKTNASKGKTNASARNAKGKSANQPDLSWTDPSFAVGDVVPRNARLAKSYPGLDLPKLGSEESYYREDENVYRVNASTREVLEVTPIGGVILH